MSQEQLHRAFLDLVFEPTARETLRTDARAFGSARGLDTRDQEAFARNQRRLGVYQALIRSSVLDPIPDCFPILKALLEGEDAWEPCLDAFFTSRSVQSLYYRDVNPTFLAWLAESAWGQERWPFLLQLAHFEYVELELLLFPETVPVSGSGRKPELKDRALFDGTFRNLAYGYRVQEADAEDPIPGLGAAFLTTFRNPEGHFEWAEVDAVTSAFLARLLQGETIAVAAQAVDLPLNLALLHLADLHDRGAILGFSELDPGSPPPP